MGERCGASLFSRAMAPSVLGRVSEGVLDRVAPGWQTVFPAESGAALAQFCAEWEARDSARERNEAVGEAEDATAARQYLELFHLVGAETALDEDVAALLCDNSPATTVQAAAVKVRGRRLKARNMTCSPSCRCLETFRDTQGPLYDAITDRLDALLLATAARSAEQEKARAVSKAVKGAKRPGDRGLESTSKRPRGQAHQGSGGEEEEEEEEETDRQRRDREKEERVAAYMDKWLAKSERRVQNRAPREKLDEYIAAQAQVLSEIRLPDRDKQGLCQKARMIITRTSDDYWRKPVKSLGDRSRIEVLGFSARKRGSTLDFSTIASREDLPVCCCGNCLRLQLHPKQMERLAEQSRAPGTSAEDRYALLTEVVRSTPRLCSTALRLLLGAGKKVSRRAKEEAVLLRLEGVERAYQHGNQGREPANKLGEAERASIQKFLDTVTWHQPDYTSKDGKGLRIPTSEDVEGITRMWKAYRSMFPDFAAEMTDVTFARYITFWLAFEHCKVHKLSSQHNVCRLCKRLMVALLRLHRSYKMAQHEAAQLRIAAERDSSDIQLDAALATASQEAARLYREHQDWVALLKAHTARDTYLRSYRNFFVSAAIYPTTQGQLQCTSVHCNDDKTPQSVPTARLQSSGPLHGWKHDVHGDWDFCDHTCSVYIPEQGLSAKDTNFTIECIIQDIIQTKKEGQDVFMTVSDCGPHQHNHFMLQLFQLLVDRGIFKFAVLLYHEQEHSKDKCDMVFGVLTQVWKREVLMSVECLARSCASRPEDVTEKYRTFMLNAETCTNFLPALDGLYEHIHHISRNGDQARNEHMMVFGHDIEALSTAPIVVENAKGKQVTTSQYKIIKDIAQPKKGWARIHTLPPRGEWCAGSSSSSEDGSDEDMEAEYEGAASSVREKDQLLYARLDPVHRDVLMHKAQPKHVDFGPRQAADTSSSEEQSLKISAAVKRVIGHSGCNCTHYDDDIASRGPDAPAILPPGHGTPAAYGHCAARDWNLRGPCSLPRHESYGMARAEPHSAGGDDANLKPQPNPDGCTDAVVVPGIGRAFRDSVIRYNKGILDEFGDAHINHSVPNSRLYNDIFSENGVPHDAATTATFAASPADVREAKRLLAESADRYTKVVPARKAAEIYGSMREDMDVDAAGELSSLMSDLRQTVDRRERFTLVQSESVAFNTLEKDQRVVRSDSDLLGMQVGQASMRGTVSSRHVMASFPMFQLRFGGAENTTQHNPALTVNAIELESLLVHAGDRQILRRTHAYMSCVRSLTRPAQLIGVAVEQCDGEGSWAEGTVVSFDGRDQSQVQCDRCERFHPLPRDGSITARDLELRAEDWFCEHDMWTEDEHMSTCVVFFATPNYNTLNKIARHTHTRAADLLQLNQASIAGLTAQSTKLNPGQRVALHQDGLPPALGSWKQQVGFPAQVAWLKARWQASCKTVRKRKLAAREIVEHARPEHAPQWRIEWTTEQQGMAWATPEQMEGLLIKPEARAILRNLREYRQWRTGKFVPHE